MVRVGIQMEPVGVACVARVTETPLEDFYAIRENDKVCLDRRSRRHRREDDAEGMVMCSTPDAVVFKGAQASRIAWVVEVKTTKWIQNVYGLILI